MYSTMMTNCLDDDERNTSANSSSNEEKEGTFDGDSWEARSKHDQPTSLSNDQGQQNVKKDVVDIEQEPMSEQRKADPEADEEDGGGHSNIDDETLDLHRCGDGDGDGEGDGDDDKANFWKTRSLVIFVHVCFVTLSVLTHFFYGWSDEEDGVVWIASTDESVFQHLKMILWPWLLILFAMDLVVKWMCHRESISREAPSIRKTWYCRSVGGSSWLGICQANIAAMLSAMLFIGVVFAIVYYAGSESLVVDVILFLVAIIGGAIVRIVWMKHETATAWISFAYLLGGTIWFFTYFSYSHDVYGGYWFNPNPYNHTDIDDHDH